MSQSLLVIGDDITGANDTGVMFADAGFTTILQTKAEALDEVDFSKAEIFSVSTSARASGVKAENLTYSAVNKAIAKNVWSIYLKIDSTMRGSVSYQIKGALKAWSKKYPQAKAVVCPAYPVMGRTIEDGHLYVNHIPVNETASGQDRICPVLTSDMSELIEGSVSFPIMTADALAEAISNTNSNVCIVDAKTEDDLDVIAQAIAKIGPSIIPVGSAGLASKLKLNATNKQANRYKPEWKRTLIFVSSIHAVSLSQIDHFLRSKKGKDSCVYIPANAQIIGDEQVLSKLKQQIKTLCSLHQDTMIIQSNSAKLYDKSIDMTKVSKEIALNLSQLCKEALESEKFDSLIIFGGDGAAALFDLLNITQMRLHYSIVPGVPLCTVESGPLHGLNILTKSGGFGKENLFDEIFK